MRIVLYGRSIPKNVGAKNDCAWRQQIYLHLCLVLQQNYCIYSILSPLILNNNHTPYLPQCKVQVRGVVAGWRDINHCVAAQRRIRAIHPQPRPIMGIPCETWELGQIAELVAHPDIGHLLRLFERSVA